MEKTGICRKVDTQEREILQVDDLIIPLREVYSIENAAGSRIDLFGENDLWVAG